MKKTARVIIYDTIAVMLFIAGLLLSPIPGPFSIPLYVLGLSLFARNHHWARRSFTYFESKMDEILPAKYAKLIAVLVVALFFLLGLVGLIVMSTLKSP